MLDNMINHMLSPSTTNWIFCLRGYDTPDQFYDYLCIFLKNYNKIIGNKLLLSEEQGIQYWTWKNQQLKISSYRFMNQILIFTHFYLKTVHNSCLY